MFQYIIIAKANIQYFEKILKQNWDHVLFIESSTEAHTATFWSHNFKVKWVL